MRTIRSRRESLRVSCSKLVSRIKAFPFSQVLFSSPTRIQQSSGTSTPETQTIDFQTRRWISAICHLGVPQRVAPCLTGRGRSTSGSSCSCSSRTKQDSVTASCLRMSPSSQNKYTQEPRGSFVYGIAVEKHLGIGVSVKKCTTYWCELPPRKYMLLMAEQVRKTMEVKIRT